MQKQRCRPLCTAAAQVLSADQQRAAQRIRLPGAARWSRRVPVLLRNCTSVAAAAAPRGARSSTCCIWDLPHSRASMFSCAECNLHARQHHRQFLFRVTHIQRLVHYRTYSSSTVPDYSAISPTSCKPHRLQRSAGADGIGIAAWRFFRTHLGTDLPCLIRSCLLSTAGALRCA